MSRYNTSSNGNHNQSDDDSDAEAGEISTPPPVLSSYAMLANEPRPPFLTAARQQQQQQRQNQPDNIGRRNEQSWNNSDFDTGGRGRGTAGRSSSWGGGGSRAPNGGGRRQPPMQHRPLDNRNDATDRYGPSRGGRGRGGLQSRGGRGGNRDANVRPFTDEDQRSRRSSSVASEDHPPDRLDAPSSSINTYGRGQNDSHNNHGRGRGGRGFPKPDARADDDQRSRRSNSMASDERRMDLSAYGRAPQDNECSNGRGRGGRNVGRRFTENSHEGRGGGRFSDRSDDTNSGERLGGRGPWMDRGGSRGRGEGGRYMEGRGGRGRGRNIDFDRRAQLDGDRPMHGDQGRGRFQGRGRARGMRDGQQLNSSINIPDNSFQNKRSRSNDLYANSADNQAKRTRLGPAESFGSDGEIADFAQPPSEAVMAPMPHEPPVHPTDATVRRGDLSMYERQADQFGGQEQSFDSHLQPHDRTKSQEWRQVTDKPQSSGLLGKVWQAPVNVPEPHQTRQQNRFNEQQIQSHEPVSHEDRQHDGQRVTSPPSSSHVVEQQPLQSQLQSTDVFGRQNSQSHLLGQYHTRDERSHDNLGHYQNPARAAQTSLGRGLELNQGWSEQQPSNAFAIPSGDLPGHADQKRFERHEAFISHDHMMMDRSDCILGGENQQSSEPTRFQAPSSITNADTQRRSSWTNNDIPPHSMQQQQQQRQDHYGPAAGLSHGEGGREGFSASMSQYGPSDQSRGSFSGPGRGRGEFEAQGRGRGVRGRGRGVFGAKYSTGPSYVNNSNLMDHDGGGRSRSSRDFTHAGSKQVDDPNRILQFEGRAPFGPGHGRGRAGRGPGFGRNYPSDVIGGNGRGRGGTGRFGRGFGDMRRNSSAGHSYASESPSFLSAHHQFEEISAGHFSSQLSPSVAQAWDEVSPGHDVDAISSDGAPPTEFVQSIIDVDEVTQSQSETVGAKSSTRPPQPAAPSAGVLALTRLLDLETQMEFAFAKHMLIVKKQKLLRVQYDVLKDLPVGIEAIKDDLAKHNEAASLYEDAAI